MGGRGSGTWLRSNRKTTVEGCLSINVSDFSANICKCVSGELKWNNAYTGNEIASVGFLQLPESKSEPMLILTYEHGDRAVHEPVSLQKTKPHFGGSRWWFTCPMCGKRVGKIYLPKKGKMFACRKCYDLVYRSSQKTRTIPSLPSFPMFKI